MPRSGGRSGTARGVPRSGGRSGTARGVPRSGGRSGTARGEGQRQSHVDDVVEEGPPGGIVRDPNEVGATFEGRSERRHRPAPEEEGEDRRDRGRVDDSDRCLLRLRLNLRSHFLVSWNVHIRIVCSFVPSFDCRGQVQPATAAALPRTQQTRRRCEVVKFETRQL
jgi:hypothetical protein